MCVKIDIFTHTFRDTHTFTDCLHWLTVLLLIVCKQEDRLVFCSIYSLIELCTDKGTRMFILRDKSVCCLPLVDRNGNYQYLTLYEMLLKIVVFTCLKLFLKLFVTVILTFSWIFNKHIPTLEKQLDPDGMVALCQVKNKAMTDFFLLSLVFSKTLTYETSNMTNEGPWRYFPLPPEGC